jgi:hypothetical protein
VPGCEGGEQTMSKTDYCVEASARSDGDSTSSINVVNSAVSQGETGEYSFTTSMGGEPSSSMSSSTVLGGSTLIILVCVAFSLL